MLRLTACHYWDEAVSSEMWEVKMNEVGNLWVRGGCVEDDENDITYVCVSLCVLCDFEWVLFWLKLFWQQRSFKARDDDSQETEQAFQQERGWQAVLQFFSLFSVSAQPILLVCFHLPLLHICLLLLLFLPYATLLPTLQNCGSKTISCM